MNVTPNIPQNIPVFDGSGQSAVAGIGGPFPLTITGGSYTFTYASVAKYSTTVNVTGGSHTFISSATPPSAITAVAWNVGSGASVNIATGLSNSSGTVKLDGAGTYTISGNMSSSSSLTKTGSGIVTMNGSLGANLTISAGNFVYNNTSDLAAGSNLYTVNSGGTLSGNGTLTRPTTINGTLSPGDGVGLMSFTRSLTLASDSTTAFSINGTTRGTGYDGLTLSGATALGGTLALTFGSTLNVGDSFDLFHYNSVTPTGGFSAVTGAGNYTGTFAPQTASLWTMPSGNLLLSFDQSTGRLSVASAIPEPATAAAFAATAALGLGVWRRRGKTTAPRG